MFRPGDKVLHQFNRDLGPGEVRVVEGARMSVHFPRTGQTLQFALKDHAFVPLVLPAGADPERWHLEFSEDMVERLVRLEVDSTAAFRNRLDGLRLSRLREAGGLGSYLGGRIQIFPHQLHVVELACRSDPVRWLLADEVGLGKTVEACLILSRLLRTGRADRVLVVAPATLVVQWLGELYRKFHQVFVLLDEVRRRDVFHDQGEDFNPFEVHPRSVISLEDLVADSRAARLARQSAPDLLVVDEAHRLERRPGHPGSPAYRAVAPLAEASRNVLLLSATPLEADTHGFFRLLELLWPDRFTSWESFREDLERDVPLHPCVSSTRRQDIGGLPPRVPRPVPLPEWPELEAAERAALRLPAGDPLERRARQEALLRAHSDPVGAGDPRIAWVAARARAWKRKQEKTLIFAARREALEVVKRELEFYLGQRVAVFHEDLSPAQRDLEVAQFAQPDGPTLLVSTECGGEGRNFEFCRRLILFDLPWDPVLVEQRIGRLDRINRRRPVEIVYFKPAGGFAAEVVRMYERLRIFREPLGGLERSLSHVEDAIRRAAGGPEGAALDVDAVIEETRLARRAMNKAVYHHLLQHRYEPGMAAEIVARIPPDLEKLTENVVVEACRQFGFEVVDRPEQRSWYIEFGNTALIDYLPGAPAESRWLGTFDRETAVARESLDFFASGHPLVEGILMELEDGHRGQVALLEVGGGGEAATGLLVVLKRGAEFIPVVMDAAGCRRPEWADLIVGPEARVSDLHPAAWHPPEGWADRVRARVHELRDEGKPVCLAAFHLG